MSGIAALKSSLFPFFNIFYLYKFIPFCLFFLMYTLVILSEKCHIVFIKKVNSHDLKITYFKQQSYFVYTSIKIFLICFQIVNAQRWQAYITYWPISRLHTYHQHLFYMWNWTCIALLTKHNSMQSLELDIHRTKYNYCVCFLKVNMWRYVYWNFRNLQDE